jgi:PAS domain S-box-containing protein
MNHADPFEATGDQATVRVDRRRRQYSDEHARARQELRSSQEQYQRLVETMNEGLAVLDLGGRITYVNEYLGGMLGYARGEFLGHLAEEYIDPAMLEDWHRIMQRRMEGDRSPYELILKARDGHRVWTKVSPNLIHDGAGNCVGSFAVVSDISAQVAAEHAQREYQQDLHEISIEVMAAQELERKHLASELHDGLGQILSAIKFSMETALMRLNGQPRESDLAAFGNIIPKIQWAIEEVRRISMDLRPSVLDDLGILAALSWFCREQRQTYAGLQLELALEIQESDIPKTLRLAIFRIVQEALNNIVKHARADTARVSLAKRDGGIVLEIADQGCGVDPEQAARKRNDGQGGMGLVTMRERAEFSGGRYRLDSTPGGGTRIRVEWPG